MKIIKYNFWDHQERVIRIIRRKMLITRGLVFTTHRDYLYDDNNTLFEKLNYVNNFYLNN